MAGIDAGDAQKAQLHFAEALRVAPTEPSLLLGAGLAAHLLGQAAFERVLTHEYTHAVARSLAPRGVPQWLIEGLAMYFEGGDLSAHVEQVRSAERPHPLTTLGRSFTNMGGHAATLAYAQSAVAVKRLIDEAGAPAIVGILTDLGRGLPFAEAFQRHANMPYADFQR